MFRYLMLLIISCCLFSIPNYASWTPNPPGIISSTNGGSQAFTAFDPATGQSLAVWVDGATSHPFYSFFTPGSGWGASTSITNSQVSSSVFVSCNPTSGHFLAAWKDFTTAQPMYSFYDGSNWSAAAAISLSSLVLNDVFVTFDPKANQFLATWGDQGSNNPIYSFYNGSSWNGAALITNLSGIAFDVVTSFDPVTMRILATWGDNITTSPTYSFYDGTNWTLPATIPNIPTSSQVQNNVFSSFDSAGHILATWVDTHNSNSPTYSFFDGSSWSNPNIISTNFSNSNDVFLSFAPTTGQFLATWSDGNNSDFPTFSFYTPGAGWSPPDTISTLSGATNNVFTSADLASGQFLAAWTDFTNGFFPTYAFYPSIPIAAPTGFKGVQKKNNFAIVSERFNTLSWKSSPIITSYLLYRNGKLIATLDGTTTFYKDHDQPKTNQIYSLVAVNAIGTSTPVSVIVGDK